MKMLQKNKFACQAQAQHGSDNRFFTEGFINSIQVNDKDVINDTAKRLVPELLDACPMNVIKSFYQKTWCCMDAYRYTLSLQIFRIN